MNVRVRIMVGLVALMVGAGGTVDAQEWRGMGRITGKVLDEQGKPVEGVTVKATLASAGNRGPEVKSNKKGEWTVAGIAQGSWALDFVKPGYETRNISVPVSEVSRIPPIEVTLKASAPDPNVVIKDRLTEAAALMNAKQYAQARSIYEDLSKQYPEVKQFEPLIARTYYGEGNKDKAIEHLRSAAAKDPNNLEVQLLLGNLLIEQGQAEEGQKLLASVDESRVSDPGIFLNAGIGMINEGRHADAVTWFDKAIARFPNDSDAYYYRGISYVSLGKPAEAKADLEKFVSLAGPDAPELATARKLLESLK